LRTPLTNIRLHVEEAIETGDDDPAFRSQCLNVINSESARLARIVGDMLSVAEIEAGALMLREDDIQMEAILRQLEKDQAPSAAEKEITLKFHLPPKLPPVYGDQDKVLLALHNLLGNAIKYTPQQGTVTVEVDVRDNNVEIRVIDSGYGIDEQESLRVFDKFYRANDDRVRAVTGSGLGLPLAREVVRMHGGDITLESTLNEGSTFTLTLPAKEAPVAA
jgi:signal transduction histidine kinase